MAFILHSRVLYQILSSLICLYCATLYTVPGIIINSRCSVLHEAEPSANNEHQELIIILGTVYRGGIKQLAYELN